MIWYYAVDAERKGPVSEAKLQELIRAGTINQSTLVWRTGMTDWQPLSAAQSGNFAGLAGTKCAECGGFFPPADIITISGAQVCATCKPILLQRLSEGAALVGTNGMYWEGRKLVCRSETPFPDHCVKCNDPANGFRLKRVLYWQHPAYYLFILCNILVLAIVLMIVRKKAILHIGLCEKHRSERRTAILIAWVGVLGGLGLLIGGIALGWVWMALCGVAGFLFGAIFGIIKGRSINASKIDKDVVWVSGVNPNFLDRGR